MHTVTDSAASAALARNRTAFSGYRAAAADIDTAPVAVDSIALLRSAAADSVQSAAGNDDVAPCFTNAANTVAAIGCAAAGGGQGSARNGNIPHAIDAEAEYFCLAAGDLDLAAGDLCPAAVHSVAAARRCAAGHCDSAAAEGDCRLFPEVCSVAALAAAAGEGHSAAAHKGCVFSDCTQAVAAHVAVLIEVAGLTARGGKRAGAGELDAPFGEKGSVVKLILRKLRHGQDVISLQHNGELLRSGVVDAGGDPVVSFVNSRLRFFIKLLTVGVAVQRKSVALGAIAHLAVPEHVGGIYARHLRPADVEVIGRGYVKANRRCGIAVVVSRLGDHGVHIIGSRSERGRGNVLPLRAARCAVRRVIVIGHGALAGISFDAGRGDRAAVVVARHRDRGCADARFGDLVINSGCLFLDRDFCSILAGVGRSRLAFRIGRAVSSDVLDICCRDSLAGCSVEVREAGEGRGRALARLAEGSHRGRGNGQRGLIICQFTPCFTARRRNGRAVCTVCKVMGVSRGDSNIRNGITLSAEYQSSFGNIRRYLITFNRVGDDRTVVGYIYIQICPRPVISRLICQHIPRIVAAISQFSGH